jgi:UDP-N-acetylglucosamine 2-epimerase (hydrolysing)
VKGFKIIISKDFDISNEILDCIVKNSKFIIGNSSAGVREAPYYNIPTINIGNRQNNRVKSNTIKTISFEKTQIIDSINTSLEIGKVEKDVDFGSGNSDKQFFDLLLKEEFWEISNQKQFKDII